MVIREPQAGLFDGLRRFVLNSAKPRHAGLDPASSVFLDSRPLPAKGQARGNDNLEVFNCRSNSLVFSRPF